jgi:SOS-response transcriptional repressor LexA
VKFKIVKNSLFEGDILLSLRRIVLAATLLNMTITAAAAEVTVEKDPPKRAQAQFFERVQAGDLSEAIARRGQPVDVKPGQYHLRVPCDSMKPGSFVDITVVIDDHSKTRLRLEECGVQVNSQQDG